MLDMSNFVSVVSIATAPIVMRFPTRERSESIFNLPNSASELHSMPVRDKFNFVSDEMQASAATTSTVSLAPPHSRELLHR